MTSPKQNRGQFKRGPDPRRHKFSRAECQDGFQAALLSIITRYPDAVDSANRHMACQFLKKRRKPDALEY